MKFENKSYRCLEIDNNGFSTFIDDACKLLCGACFDRLYFYDLEASQFFNSSKWRNIVLHKDSLQ